MILHGYCDIWSDGGIFGGGRSATLEIRPTLELFNWSADPYFSLGYKEEILAVAMYTDTGHIWDDADSEQQDVFRGYELSKTLTLVPPGTNVGVVLSAAIIGRPGQNSGRVQIDFSTGNYQVAVPSVLITVLS
jgi:hypothetical protein